MTNRNYRVMWTSYARVALARMKPYKVDPMNVFRRSKDVLCHLPHEKAYGISDFPGFEFNDYYWTLIGNAILIYRIDHNLLHVYVDACFYANNAASHQVFWGIEPEDE
ncbi:hypothetical protein AZ66_05490 [Paenibacillus sp. E194]|uniref:hypothetical protein n=1 Tax=Paenibacillus sp. E194 TaxID=1458845 RepID=UPI0005C9C6E5|nr:hypothetical protein [Paenibacillus sp. E194]KJB88760.1 hypothetical protein AZ66_05490 [Paenibacillus sp. E194]